MATKNPKKAAATIPARVLLNKKLFGKINLYSSFVLSSSGCRSKNATEIIPVKPDADAKAVSMLTKSSGSG